MRKIFKQIRDESAYVELPWWTHPTVVTTTITTLFIAAMVAAAVADH